MPRSLGGDDLDANLIPLCARCHAGWEDRIMGWRYIARKIRLTLRPEEYEYVVTTKSLVFMDRYYPLTAREV